MKTNSIGQDIYRWAADLFPICRSITGNGERKTLAYLKKLLPELKIYEVPTGTKAFDWVVPNEWNIKDAYVADEEGKRIIDFQKNNLHVVGYSMPVDKVVDLDELEKHLHSLPKQPDAIPYATSYYEQKWGFCLTHNQRAKLKPGKYRVKIVSTLEPGYMTYGELIIRGQTKKEIFISSYICHPSLAHNELSGVVVTAALAQWICRLKNRKYTYRIIFIPETIGSIFYLSKNLKEMKRNIIAGFIPTCVGDERTYSFLPSKTGDTLADRVARHVLNHHAENYISWSFLDRESDERQYCWPGIDLPVAYIMRSKYRSYPEYHTSLDNLSFVSPRGLEGSFEAYRKCIEILENNETYKTMILCEPFLSKRGILNNASAKEKMRERKKIMNFLVYSDGQHDMLSIAEITNTYAGDFIPVIEKLLKENLIERM